MKITEIHIHPVTPQRGLVAFAHVVINSCLLLGSIAIHEKRSGGWRITYPQKGSGYVFRPITHAFSQILEDAVISEAKTVLSQAHAGHYRADAQSDRV